MLKQTKSKIHLLTSLFSHSFPPEFSIAVGIRCHRVQQYKVIANFFSSISSFPRQIVIKEEVVGGKGMKMK
jgi:hypothetical protein